MRVKMRWTLEGDTAMVCHVGNSRTDQPTRALSLPIVASSREKLLRIRRTIQTEINACEVPSR